MPQNTKKEIVIEVPESLVKLSKKEADQLKEIFKTEVVKILSAKAPGALFSITTQNTKHKPPLPTPKPKPGKAGPGGGAKGAAKSS